MEPQLLLSHPELRAAVLAALEFPKYRAAQLAVIQSDSYGFGFDDDYVGASDEDIEGVFPNLSGSSLIP